MVYPTHGAGSLCSTGIAVDVVVDHRLRTPPRPAPGADGGGGLRAGVAVRAADDPALLRADAPDQPGRTATPGRERPGHRAAVRCAGWSEALGRGAVVVDTRSPAKHARRHVPGSLSIPAGPSFGTWLGWVVEADAPIVLIVDDPADLDDLSRQAIRIGCETIEGYVDGGFEGWAPVRSSGRGRRGDRCRRPGARRCRRAVRWRRSSSTSDSRTSSRPATCPAPSTSGRASCPTVLDRLPHDREVALVCASGYRSSVAASLLRAGGFSRVAAVAGGTPDWEAHGYPLDYGAGTDGLDWPRHARRRPRALGRRRLAEPRDPEDAQRGDPEQDRVQDDHDPDRPPGQDVARPGRWRGRPSAAGRWPAGP